MMRFTLILIGVVALLAVPSSGGSTTKRDLAYSRNGHIWTIGADGKGAQIFIRNAYQPAWSPDGSRIAFVSNRSGDEELYVARADGSGVTRLTTSPGPDLSPDWSSDGKRIAWSRDREIWTMSASGSNKRARVRKAQHWHEHHSPTWHGIRIIYSSNRVSNFNTELYLAPTKRLTFTQGSEDVFGDDGMPDFSPDGRKIAFTSNREQQGEIYVMNWNGSGLKRLTHRAGDDWAPDFSPDGRRIAFTQLPGSIWVMNADGTGLRKLTSGTDADWRPVS